MSSFIVYLMLIRFRANIKNDYIVKSAGVDPPVLKSGGSGHPRRPRRRRPCPKGVLLVVILNYGEFVNPAVGQKMDCDIPVVFAELSQYFRYICSCSFAFRKVYYITEPYCRL